jgi:hypothetical protein
LQATLIVVSSQPAELPAVELELERDRNIRWPRLARLFRGGTEGNARLTATTAIVLLVLLAAEGATIPFVRQQLTLHIFLGLLLIPPVLLKLATTAWRFARYYRGAVEYVAKGPPHVFMRLLVAPLVVASTAALFGTGVLLVLLHPQGGIVLGLHKASFVVWFGAMAAHVIGHVLKVPGLARVDLDRALPGTRLRRFLVAGAIVAGLIVAIAGLPAAHGWAQWATLNHRHDG